MLCTLQYFMLASYDSFYYYCSQISLWLWGIVCTKWSEICCYSLCYHNYRNLFGRCFKPILARIHVNVKQFVLFPFHIVCFYEFKSLTLKKDIRDIFHSYIWINVFKDQELPGNNINKYRNGNIDWNISFNYFSSLFIYHEIYRNLEVTISNHLQNLLATFCSHFLSSYFNGIRWYILDWNRFRFTNYYFSNGTQVSSCFQRRHINWKQKSKYSNRKINKCSKGDWVRYHIMCNQKGY